MCATDVNREVLRALLEAYESVVEEDVVSPAGLRSGVVRRDDQGFRAKARRKRNQALVQLRSLLPATAYAYVAEEVAQHVVPPGTRNAATSLYLWDPQRRLQHARQVLRDAARVQRETEQKAQRDRAAAQEAASRAALRDRLAEEAHRVFDVDFLGADAWFASTPEGVISSEEFLTWKAEFVRRWARRAIQDDRLDLDQARAVATTTTDLQVVARAGSGKTRTVVTRALFLMLHCHVQPKEILLVAFNRKAVHEIRNRLQAVLREAPLPHVVTFHALAYALLRPKEELVFDDEDASSYAQSGKVQDIMSELLTRRHGDVRSAMMGFFDDDWVALRHRGLDLTREEFFARQDAFTSVTFAGEYVKSRGERLIANTLFRYGVDYKYERNYTPGGFNYRPDFTILAGPKPRVVIEYFGLVGDAKYDKESAKKREFWKSQNEITFLEYHPADVAQGPEQFELRLLHALGEAGVPLRRLTDDETWDRVRKRAEDTFTKTVKNYIARARQLDLTPTQVRAKQAAQPADALIQDFAALATDVYEEYLARAKIEGYEDFSGVVWRAAQTIRDGCTTWTRAAGSEHGDLRLLRFIHVDEFQDFSKMLMAFLSAIRSAAPTATVCCVGDDWQAINAFAGADMRYHTNFPRFFLGSVTQTLARNYRSASAIVDAGNALMQGHGDPAKASKPQLGRVRIAYLNTFNPTAPERHHHGVGDLGTPALLRLIQDALERTEGTVTVLFRRNAVPWFTTDRRGFGSALDRYRDRLRSYLGKDDANRVDVTTTHKYKGRDAGVVIVGDADARAYPLVHPTASLFGVFGDSAIKSVDSDKRLMYVATTRAELELCYLVTTDDPSPFLDRVISSATTQGWDLSPVVAKDAVLEVRVYGGYDIRHVLGAELGFAYDPLDQAWSVCLPARGFDFQKVRQRLEVGRRRLIEVRDESGRLIHTTGALFDGR